MVSGYRKISKPNDLEKALVAMLNKILLSDDPITHCGKFAALANSWCNAHRLALESGEWAAIKERLDLLEQAQSFDSTRDAFDFKKAMADVKEMMKAL